MAKLVLDTNVYIHAIRNAQARLALAAWQRRMAPHIHQHAIVVSEILIGARDEATLDLWHERWVAPAERVGRVITPGYGSWLRATRIVVWLGRAGHVGPDGPAPSFFNDCLLAAGSLEHGYTLVTHNLADFRAIARVEPGVRFVAPLP